MHLGAKFGKTDVDRGEADVDFGKTLVEAVLEFGREVRIASQPKRKPTMRSAYCP